MAAHYNKQGGADGIYCDLCGLVFINKFSYYSGKFDKIEVDKDSGKHGIVDIDRRCLDVDFCDGCWNEMKDKMLKTLEDVDKQRQREKAAGAWTTSPDGTQHKPVQHKQRLRP